MKKAANDPDEYEKGKKDFENKVTYKPGRSKSYTEGFEDSYWQHFKETIKNLEGWK